MARIAVVQMDVALGEVEQNLSAMLRNLEAARANGAEVVLFPECALTGYCFANVNEAAPYAEDIPGPSTQRFQEALRRLGGYAVVGMLERAPRGVFNAAVLIGPDGVIGSYRKVHLPYLGVDQFADFGDRPFEVHQAGDLRIGLSICYDSAFPEAMRTLALEGADLIALPTNFPSGAEGMVDFALRTRALENHVFFAACNRIGEERGFRFIGGSQIIDPSGRWLARSESLREEILYADIDPGVARRKQVVRVPQKHAIDRMADRRPEMYSLLTQPHDLPRPGGRTTTRPDIG